MMLTREDLLSIRFVDKEDFAGSHKGMRFMLHKEMAGEEKKLKVYIWSEPFGFAATSDEKKISELFDFSEDGMAAALEWMNERYEFVRSRDSFT